MKHKPEFSKENPLWTECVFDGPPPVGYDSWYDWIERSTKTGLFKGVKIQSVQADVKGCAVCMDVRTEVKGICPACHRDLRVAVKL